jgi:peroxiredoxin
VDLQASTAYQSLDVPLLSIAFDPPAQMAPTRQEYGIAIPMLTDPDHRVSEAYGVLEWAVASGEPGHTFVLVGVDGRIAWIQDYGAPQNRGVMYVDPEEIAAELEQALD